MITPDRNYIGLRLKYRVGAVRKTQAMTPNHVYAYISAGHFFLIDPDTVTLGQDKHLDLMVNLNDRKDMIDEFYTECEDKAAKAGNVADYHIKKQLQISKDKQIAKTEAAVKPTVIITNDKDEIVNCGTKDQIFELQGGVTMKDMLGYVLSKGIIPTVSSNGIIIQRIGLGNGIFVSTMTHKLGVSEGEPTFVTPEEMAKFTANFNDLKNTVFVQKYKSYYSDNVHDIYEKYAHGGLCGRYNFNASVLDDVDMVSEIDFKSAYPSIMRDMTHIPIVKYSNPFIAYDGDKIRNHYIYIVKRTDDFDFDDDELMCSFNKPTNVMYGFELNKHSYKSCGVEVTAFQRTTMVPSADVGKMIQSIFDDKGLPKELKKFALNWITGLVGKLNDTKCAARVFSDKYEAMYYTSGCDKMDKMLKIMQYKTEYGNYSLVRNTTVTPMYNGFYPIKLFILSMMRVKIIRLRRELMQKNLVVLGVHTDCIFTTVDDNELTLKHFKIGTNLGDVKPPVTVSINKLSRSYMNRNMAQEQLDIEFKDESVNQIPIEDEYDIDAIQKSIEGAKSVLIRGSAGTGKSYICSQIARSRFASTGKPALFMTPTNKRRINLLKEETAAAEAEGREVAYDAMTKNHFLGYAFSNKWKNNYKSEDYSVIIIEELYMCSAQDRLEIYMFMKKHPEQLFISNGDEFQCRIDTDTEAADTETNYIFNSQMTLRIVKRSDSKRDQKLLTEVNHNISHGINLDVEKYFRTVSKLEDIDLDDYDESLGEPIAIAYTNLTAIYVNNYIYKQLHPHAKSLFDVGINVIFRGAINRVFKSEDGEQHGKLVNHQVYRIDEYSVDKKTKRPVVILKSLDDDDRVEYSVSVDLLNAKLFHQYCATGHSCQGDTIEGGNIVIFEHDHFYAGQRWVYTAITRARSPTKQNRIFTGELPKFRMNEGLMNRRIASHRRTDIKTFDKDVCDLNVVWVTEKYKQQKGVCPLCLNVILNCQDMSVDRIDSDEPHVKRNCQLTCVDCNKAKGSEDRIFES